MALLVAGAGECPLFAAVCAAPGRPPVPDQRFKVFVWFAQAARATVRARWHAMPRPSPRSSHPRDLQLVLPRPRPSLRRVSGALGGRQFMWLVGGCSGVGDNWLWCAHARGCPASASTRPTAVQAKLKCACFSPSAIAVIASKDDGLGVLLAAVQVGNRGWPQLNRLKMYCWTHGRASTACHYAPIQPPIHLSTQSHPILPTLPFISYSSHPPIRSPTHPSHPPTLRPPTLPSWRRCPTRTPP